MSFRAPPAAKPSSKGAQSSIASSQAPVAPPADRAAPAPPASKPIVVDAQLVAPQGIIVAGGESSAGVAAPAPPAAVVVKNSPAESMLSPAVRPPPPQPVVNSRVDDVRQTSFSPSDPMILTPAARPSAAATAPRVHPMPVASVVTSSGSFGATTAIDRMRSPLSAIDSFTQLDRQQRSDIPYHQQVNNTTPTERNRFSAVNSAINNVSSSSTAMHSDREVSLDHAAVMRSALRVLNQRAQQQHEEQQSFIHANQRAPTGTFFSSPDGVVTSPKPVVASSSRPGELIEGTSAIVSSPNRPRVLLSDAAVVLMEPTSTSYAQASYIPVGHEHQRQSPRRKTFVRAVEEAERVAIPVHTQSPVPQRRSGDNVTPDVALARDAALAFLRPQGPPKQQLSSTSPAAGTAAPGGSATPFRSPFSPVSTSSSGLFSSQPNAAAPLLLPASPVVHAASHYAHGGVITAGSRCAASPATDIPTFVHKFVPNTVGVWTSPQLRHEAL